MKRARKAIAVVVLTCFAQSATAQSSPPTPIAPGGIPPRPPVIPPTPKKPGSLTGPASGSAKGPSEPAGTSVIASGGGSSVKESDMKAAAQKGGRFHFDFAKAPIGDIVKVISEITQKNFIIPEKVKGQQLTIMCPKPVTHEEAYRAFLSALEANDITIVKAGAFYKLIQSQDAAKNPVPTYGSKEDVPPTDNMVTKLLRLQHADANGISQILKTFASKFAQIAVYAPTNALIISEYGSNLVRLEDLLTNLDTEGSNDQIHLFKVQYAAATDMAQRLSELFDVKKGTGATGRPATPNPPAAGAGGATQSEDTLSISKLIADERTNQLIIVANEYAFKQIKDILSKLDVPVGEETGQVRVIALQNANAEDLAGVLSSLATGQTNKKPKTSSNPSAPAQPAAPGGGGNSAASLFEGEVKITADKSTNSLVVIASPRDFRSLKRMVEQLDLPRRQVFVELAIMEVTNSDTLNIGTQWYSGITAGSGGSAPFKNGVGIINSPTSGAGSLVTQAINPATLLGAFGGALAGFAGTPINVPGPNGTSISLPSFAVLLRALQESSNANVISTPYLLATDNEESVIEVGQKIPFASGVPGIGGGSSLGGLASSLGGSAAGGISSALGALGGLGGGLGFAQVQRIDVSLKISMTPHINDSDRVMIELDQTLEDLIDEKPINGVPIPVTAKRMIKSKVVVEDQQTIVLGGLIRDTVKESVTRYPLLGDIPILGWLFKTKKTTKDKSNLFVVLTPYIIRQRADFQHIYERKQKEYKNFVDMFYSSSKEYRATVDFSHKNGPLALLAKSVNKEMERIENGGHGDGDVLIVPNGEVKETINDPSAPQKPQPTKADDVTPQGEVVTPQGTAPPSREPPMPEPPVQDNSQPPPSPETPPKEE